MRDALVHDIANDWPLICGLSESDVCNMTHAHVSSARHAALLKKADLFSVTE